MGSQPHDHLGYQGELRGHRRGARPRGATGARPGSPRSAPHKRGERDQPPQGGWSQSPPGCSWPKGSHSLTMRCPPHPPPACPVGSASAETVARPTGGHSGAGSTTWRPGRLGPGPRRPPGRSPRLGGRRAVQEGGPHRGTRGTPFRTGETKLYRQVWSLPAPTWARPGAAQPEAPRLGPREYSRPAIGLANWGQGTEPNPRRVWPSLTLVRPTGDQRCHSGGSER